MAIDLISKIELMDKKQLLALKGLLERTQSQNHEDSTDYRALDRLITIVDIYIDAWIDF